MLVSRSPRGPLKPTCGGEVGGAFICQFERVNAEAMAVRVTAWHGDYGAIGYSGKCDRLRMTGALTRAQRRDGMDGCPLRGVCRNILAHMRQ